VADERWFVLTSRASRVSPKSFYRAPTQTFPLVCTGARCWRNLMDSGFQGDADKLCSLPSLTLSGLSLANFASWIADFRQSRRTKVWIADPLSPTTVVRWRNPAFPAL
jgi:hypothetical protein